MGITSAEGSDGQLRDRRKVPELQSSPRWPASLLPVLSCSAFLPFHDLLQDLPTKSHCFLFFSLS